MAQSDYVDKADKYGKRHPYCWTYPSWRKTESRADKRHRKHVVRQMTKQYIGKV